MSARPGFLLAAGRPTSTEECQQLDISASLGGYASDHRDRPLSFRWKADYATLSRSLDLPPCKSRKAERAMASILYDAALSARENPEMRISYSRRKAFYAMAGRYEGTDYGYDTIVPAVDALVDAGLLVDHDKVKGDPVATGVQSSFRPAPGLADIVLPRPEYRVGEIIRLKDASGALIGYRDTERTARDRRSLDAINRHIAEADIRLGHINGVVHDDEAGTIRFPGFLQWLDEGLGDHTVYTRMTELYRVYNGSWTLGGRFYGGWWQQVRGIDREHLLIDGSATVEHDYKMLHPRLLYAIAGRRLEGDAYTLAGWDRKVCKRAFNILLNARNYKQALGAILPHVGNSRKAAMSLITAMKMRHAAVADSFHSGVGLRLQNLDAEMAKSVLRDLTIRQDITVLPVHDSFIVREEHQTKLEEAMDRAYFGATASDGDPLTVSKLYPIIYPHREGATGPNGVLEGGTAGPDEMEAEGATRPDGARGRAAFARSDPTGPMIAPLSPAPAVPMGSGHETGNPACHCADIASGIVPASSGTRDGVSCPAGASRVASAPGVTVETVLPVREASVNTATSEFDSASQGPETAHTPLPPRVGSSDTGIPETVTIRQREARQSLNENPDRPVDPVIPAKAILPPAFLNPANRDLALVEELKRLAGRPLNDGPTIDRLGKRRR